MDSSVSVIIPVLVLTDDLFAQAKAAIESVRDGVELIIVDNGSTIGSEYFRGVADVYLRYPEPIGFGRACNIGISHSHGDYIVITSIDVEYLVGSPHDLAKTQLPVVCPSAEDKGQELDFQLHLNETFGATFAISREAYDIVKLPEGLYDERFEHGYYEDTDLWYRCDEIGIPLVRTGKVLVVHGQGTTNKHLGVLDKYMEINKKKFGEKWNTNEVRWRG